MQSYTQYIAQLHSPNPVGDWRTDAKNSDKEIEHIAEFIPAFSRLGQCNVDKLCAILEDGVGYILEREEIPFYTFVQWLYGLRLNDDDLCRTLHALTSGFDAEYMDDPSDITALEAHASVYTLFVDVGRFDLLQKYYTLQGKSLRDVINLDIESIEHSLSWSGHICVNTYFLGFVFEQNSDLGLELITRMFERMTDQVPSSWFLEFMTHVLRMPISPTQIDDPRITKIWDKFDIAQDRYTPSQYISLHWGYLMQQNPDVSTLDRYNSIYGYIAHAAYHRNRGDDAPFHVYKPYMMALLNTDEPNILFGVLYETCLALSVEHSPSQHLLADLIHDRECMGLLLSKLLVYQSQYDQQCLRHHTAFAHAGLSDEVDVFDPYSITTYLLQQSKPDIRYEDVVQHHQLALSLENGNSPLWVYSLWDAQLDAIPVPDTPDACA